MSWAEKSAAEVSICSVYPLGPGRALPKVHRRLASSKLLGQEQMKIKQPFRTPRCGSTLGARCYQATEAHCVLKGLTLDGRTVAERGGKVLALVDRGAARCGVENFMTLTVLGTGGAREEKVAGSSVEVDCHHKDKSARMTFPRTGTAYQ